MLSAYLFLIVCAYVVGQVARDALFLGSFSADLLPYADICVFLLVCAAVGFYIRVGGQTGLLRVSRSSLLFFGVSGLVFALLARDAVAAWLFPIVYVWVGVFGVVAPTQVWTLANYVLTPREARRLFGFIGAGATLGATVGGILSKLLAQRYGAASLLLMMAGLVFAATTLVGGLWRRRPARPVAEPRAGQPAAANGLQTSLELVLRSPYLRAIAGVIAISSFVTSLCGWQLKAIAQQALVATDALAAFFGTFNATVGVACLVVQLLLTAGVIRNLGLRSVLFLLPLGLVLGSGGLLVFGSLAAAAALKAIDKVLRYSIDRPAVELLYLPVPPEAKLAAKSLIDTLVWRAGDGLAALTVLSFATLGGLSPVQLSWVALPLLAVWLVTAARAYRRYLARLEQSVQQHRLDTERAAAPLLDRSTTRLIASRLDAVDPREILYALDLMRVAAQPATHPAVRGLLDHPAPQVRVRALELLDAVGDRTVLPRVESLLSDPRLEVRTVALLYLARHADFDPVTRVQELGEFPDFSIRAAVVAVLARLGDERLESAQLLFEAMVDERGAAGRRTRHEAARLAERLPVVFEAALRRLIDDEDEQVARAAIRAAREQGAEPFIEALVARLGDPSLRDDAAAALASVGDGVVAPLARRLADRLAPPELRHAVPGVLERIASDAAVAVLAEHLLQADAALRLRLLQTLERLRDAKPWLTLDRRPVEAVLGAEILGHYRSYQILGTLQGSGHGGRAVEEGLRAAMREELERVFRLLHLLEPGVDVRSAWAALQSGDPVLRDQAFDLLEGLLQPPLRKLLLPLIDPEIPDAERLRLANRHSGAALDTPVQAVRALISTGDPWLRACAAYAIGALALDELAEHLEAWRGDPDPLLRESVRQAREQLARRGAGQD